MNAVNPRQIREASIWLCESQRKSEATSVANTFPDQMGGHRKQRSGRRGAGLVLGFRKPNPNYRKVFARREIWIDGVAVIHRNAVPLPGHRKGYRQVKLVGSCPAGVDRHPGWGCRAGASLTYSLAELGRTAMAAALAGHRRIRRDNSLAMCRRIPRQNLYPTSTPTSRRAPGEMKEPPNSMAGMTSLR